MSFCDRNGLLCWKDPAECTSACQYKQPPYKRLEKYEKWCELPLHLRLSTPLELPFYKPSENQFSLSGSILGNREYYGKVDDIVQIVAQLQSKVNGSEIEMKNKESEYNSKIEVVRRQYIVETSWG